MDIKKAKSLVTEMLELCSKLEDETLDEACTGIYNDLQACKSLPCVLDCARELMIFCSEAPWEETEVSDLRDEVESIYEELQEESEEF